MKAVSNAEGSLGAREICSLLIVSVYIIFG